MKNKFFSPRINPAGANSKFALMKNKFFSPRINPAGANSKFALMKNKKAAMELSFGMLFSIFLIIIFIAFAIYGIGKFLNLQKNIQTKTFISDLQFDIDKLWNSQGSQPVDYPLPANVEKVCFNEDDFEKDIDLEIKGEKFIQTYDIKHAKISENFSKGSGGNCVSVKDRKLSLQLEKDYNEALVTIEKV